MFAPACVAGIRNASLSAEKTTCLERTRGGTTVREVLNENDQDRRGACGGTRHVIMLRRGWERSWRTKSRRRRIKKSLSAVGAFAVLVLLAAWQSADGAYA